MQLTHLETYIVRTPPPHIGGQYWILLKIATACGIEGVGEVYSATFHPEVMVKAVEDVFEAYLKGRDPHHIERFFRNCYSSGYTQRVDLSMMGVVSGLEMAMWDIVGKAHNKPVYELLGGKMHDKLRGYTYLYPALGANGFPDYDSVDASVEAAHKYVERGFTGLKFDPLGEYSTYGGYMASLGAMDKTEEFCRELRNAVGNKCDLLLGTHGQMSTSSARRLAKRLEQYDLFWYEEPIPPGQNAEMGKVAASTNTPIATGERLASRYEFHELFVNNAVSIAMPDLGRVGGILETKKIAAMAEMYNVHIAPHVYSGPIVTAASIQVAACIPNFVIIECIEDYGGFHEEILMEKIPFENGHIIPSDKPGLGVELNMDVVKANSPYTGRRLHLSMVDKPYDVTDSVGYLNKRNY